MNITRNTREKKEIKKNKKEGDPPKLHFYCIHMDHSTQPRGIFSY